MIIENTVDEMDKIRAEAEEQEERDKAWREICNGNCPIYDAALCSCSDVMRTDDMHLAAALVALEHPIHYENRRYEDGSLLAVVFKKKDDHTVDPLYTDVCAYEDGTLSVPLKKYREAFARFDYDAKHRELPPDHC